MGEEDRVPIKQSTSQWRLHHVYIRGELFADDPHAPLPNRFKLHIGIGPILVDGEECVEAVLSLERIRG